MNTRRAIRRGVNAALAAVRRQPTRGRVLLYHEVGDRVDPVASVPRSVFRLHVEVLASRGFRLRSVGEMLGASCPPDVVALSFDDGDASIVDVCGELADAGHSATAFIVPAWIDSRRPNACTWNDVAAMARRGIEIGSHDLAHERPCGVPVDMLAERYRRARARIEQCIGAPVQGIAYPYGLAPARARIAAALAGYSYAVTSEPGRNGPASDPFRIRRNEVHGTDATERSLLGKLSGSDDWFAVLRALENRLACA